jgi:hypothetical protein
MFDVSLIWVETEHKLQAFFYPKGQELAIEWKEMAQRGNTSFVIFFFFLDGTLVQCGPSPP